MRLRDEDRVTMEIAEGRALAALSRREPRVASYIAGFIWPDHSMKAQGAGAAASRILKRLHNRNLAKWKSDGRNWGWVRT